MVKAIGFTRLCWDCKGKKVALGGKLDKMKLWRCAACVGNGMKWKWNMADLYKERWHKGPPPSIGWWPTVVNTRTPCLAGYRWWDGECWSWPAFMHESAEKASRWAAKKETLYVDIEWTDRPANWPERSKT
jgi:hypothetical protein